jgi:hypothetical protein
MRTPKESFLVSGHAAEFAKLVANEHFCPACEYALLQLQSEMAPSSVPGQPTDPYVGLDSNSQMFGARRVLKIMQDLPIPEKSTQPKRESLHYAR